MNRQTTRSAEIPDALLGLLPDSGIASEDGHVVLAGVPIAEIVERFGTPTYVFDVSTFRARARAMKEGLARRWPNSEVLFASKSFPLLAMYQLAAAEGLSCDVAGDGELRLAITAGFDPSRLYFHGNAKTEAELRLAVGAGVGTIIVDNTDEFDRIRKLVRGGSRQDVLVRLLPGVSSPTHPSVDTGGPNSKFGLPLDQAVALMEEIESSPNLRLRGVHVHMGSQILKTGPFVEAVRRVAAVGDFEVYDIGGGLGTRYTTTEEAPSIDSYLDAVSGVAHELLPPEAKLLIEPGRSLVAAAGVTVYRVISVKHTGRIFVAVDGGMADNMDVALTGQRYSAIIDGKANSPGTVECTLVGRHCESGDKLIDEVSLPTPAVTDLIVMLATGAYSFTLANNYNGAFIPPVVFVEGGHCTEVSRRQSFEDILALQRPLAARLGGD